MTDTGLQRKIEEQRERVGFHRDYYEADPEHWHSLAVSVADYEALLDIASAAEPALDLLAAEGYDGHYEGRGPVCAEYENLKAALTRFTQPQAGVREDSDPSVVLGSCPHGVDLDREFCPEGCRV